MPNCCVSTCKKRSESSSIQKDNISFHLFPNNAKTRDAWRRACVKCESWTPKRTSTICSQHFENSLFIHLANNKRRLKQGAVPTLNLFKVDHCENSETTETQECRTTEDPLESNICHSPNSSADDPELKDTPREEKLRKILQIKKKQIKRLNSQIGFLKKKVIGLQNTLSDLSKKSLINKKV